MKKRLIGVFPAFQQKNYRLYFTGQLVSLIGTWLHVVAEGWLAYELTHSAFWVGIIAALNTLPVLLFSLFGGAIIDRFPKKTILYYTQTFALIIASLLGILTLTHTIAVWNMSILVFCMGLTQVFDMPARQSFMTEMIEKRYLASALAINSGMFNSARAIGPAIAGILLAFIGPGGVFIINGFSFLAGILALYLIKQVKILPIDHTSPLKAIRHGLSYTYRHPHIKYLLIIVGATSIFGWSYGTIFPIIVTRIFHEGAENLGYFHSAVGIGAILGAITISAFSVNLPVTLFVFGATGMIAAMLTLFTFAQTLPVAYIMLFFLGYFLVLQFSTINSVLHHEIDDSVRGRVMSIFTFMSVGLSPFGSFLIGSVSDLLNPFWALRINAAIFIAIAAIVYFLYSKRPIVHKAVHTDTETPQTQWNLPQN